jgi:hypothetical protein
LKSDAAAEKSKDQLSRDFPGRSIFDFCNNIGTTRNHNPHTECPLPGAKRKTSVLSEYFAF